MILELHRYKDTGKTTFGRLTIDGYDECITLEDTHNDKKINGKTRIPEGIYKVVVREYGGHYERFKKRWIWHRGMLQIDDVPNFTDILIHIGNHAGDTSGCILVGDVADENNERIRLSMVAYERVYKKVIDAAYAGELTIKIDNIEEE